MLSGFAVTAPFSLFASALLMAVAPGCGSNPTTAPTHAAGADGGSGTGAPPSDADGGTPYIAPDGSTAGTSSAATLAGKLGKPDRLLVGLGSTPGSDITAQGIKPDLYDEYLVGVGSTDWTTWNSPPGSYANDVAATADSLGAVPMFTLYQMAQNGDGNITGINDPTFMTPYWANVVLLFQRLAIFGKPAVVHFEPDFWGYTEQASPGGDPTMLAASVTVAPDCANLGNNVRGIAQCLIQIARKYAPQAYVGFSPSTWGASTIADVVTYMQNLGAGGADIIVMQTLDRDAGCFEAATEADCMRQGTGWYWDETNMTHPNFQDHLAQVAQLHQGLNLPVVWWQTPLGVPSTTPGGTPNHYRDDRVHYFLTNPSQLVAVGGLGVVFSGGSSDCTGITTDNGQFQMLSSAYLASPAPL